MDTIAKIRAEIKSLQDIFVKTAEELETEDEATVYSTCAVEFGDELLSFLDTLEEPVEKTCKTCGFYENNCPFIRGKFISYPNKVCKDYTFSTLKAEQEPVSENLEEEIDRVMADYSFTKTIDSGGFKTTVLDYEKIAHHFAEWGAEHLRDSTKKISDDLEEAAEKYADLNCHNHVENETDWSGLLYAFKAGAEWQKKQIPMPEDTVIFQKGVEEGKRLIMEGAVEGEVVKDISNKLAVTAKNINLDGLKFGDKVRIIILPKEEE